MLIARSTGLLVLLLILTACGAPIVAVSSTPTTVPATSSTPAPSAPAASSAPTPTLVAQASAASELTAAPTNTPQPTTPPTSVPAPTALPTAPPRTDGVIFFLAPDGKTIKTIRPDGSDENTLLTIRVQPGDEVADLTADPNGRFLLYSVSGQYFLVERGQAQPLMRFSAIPRWAPDGVRFVTAQADASDVEGPLYLYDAAQRQGRALEVKGMAPDWFPDGKRIVYVNNGNVYIYDLAQQTSAQVTRLPTAIEQAWALQEAHVLPDGQNIIFYGGEGKNLGASGNGQQWWSIPVRGGQPQPYTDPAGNYITAFAISPQGNWVAYVENMHDNACISAQYVTIRASGIGGGSAINPAISERNEQAESYVFLRNVTWAPDNDRIAYGVQPYRCSGAGRTLGKPVIYVWSVNNGTNPGGNVAPRKLIDGSYPVWTK